MMTKLLRRFARLENPNYLLLIGATFLLAFIYLGVPIVTSSLLAANILSQCALGTVVISRLFGKNSLSPLLAVGPGLLLGGTLAFAVFQVAGRGGTGLLCASGLCAAAFIWKFKNASANNDWASAPRILSHLVGLAALAMSSEFSWLLTVAGAGLLAGLIFDPTRREFGRQKLLGIGVIATALVIGLLTRGNLWWLITDDYKFFEVISRHITQEGPFEPWGSLSVSKYHWLSYGWAGLLDFASLRSEVFLTLTRVMPVVYSFIFAASLMLIDKVVSRLNGTWFKTSLIPWVVMAAARPDWSAPSTAGAFAVVAAFVSLVLLGMEVHASTSKRLALYGIFGVIAVLTKLPSALTLLSVVAGAETSLRLTRSKRLRILHLPVIYVALAGFASIALLQPMGAVVGSVSVIWADNSIFLSPLSIVRDLAVAVLQNSWILVLIAFLWIWTRRSLSEGRQPSSDVFLFSLSPLIVVSIAMRVVIPGTDRANLHEYFSGPNQLLSLFSIFLFHRLSKADLQRQSGRVMFQVLWGSAAVGFMFLPQIYQRIGFPNPLGSSQLLVAITDSRLIFGLIITGYYLSSIARSHTFRLSHLRDYFLCIVIVSVLSSFVDFKKEQFLAEPAALDVISALGDPGSQVVGKWLNSNSSPSQLIATNALRDLRTGLPGDDFALATWSNREFLVLGPKYFGAETRAKTYVQLCLRFGNEPNENDAETLLQLGVTWFIIDTHATDTRSWSPWADVAFKESRYWVLEMRDTEIAKSSLND